MKLILTMLLLFSIQVRANICDQASKCSKEFWVNHSHLRYYQSHNDGDTKVAKAIFVIHGALRNGDEYFEHMVDAAKLNNVLGDTVVVAPHFRKVTDTRVSKELYWGRRWYQKWKYGYVSQDPDQISSFEVMDRLILDLANRFPNLNEFTLIGHSAGGQFTQRYAIGTDIHKQVSITFVPSNPSSYMYLHRSRYEFINGNFGEATSTDCPEFNHYIYGPINRASYLAKKTIPELVKSYASKKVIYLMSEQDKGEGSLDRTCEANRQGKNRINRAQNYYHYLNKKFSQHNHRFIGIPNIGHDHQDVFKSQEASATIFGTKKHPGNGNFSYRKIGQRNRSVSIKQDNFLLLGGGKNESIGLSAFLKKLNGGNLLVISTKDKLHHRYTFDFWRLAEEKGINISSVETISFHSRDAGEEAFVLDKIQKADAIFFTGGNQAKYIRYIKGTTAHHEILAKRVPIAGTSAGLAIMGEYIFAARNGGVSSPYALKYPNDSVIDIEYDFFSSPLLSDLITDTHFSERSREGRLLSFMAKAQDEYKATSIFGLGVDEQTSVSITSQSLQVNGKGDATLYFKDSAHSNASGALDYKNIKKLPLKKRFEYSHFSQILMNQAEVLNVTAGRIK